MNKKLILMAAGLLLVIAIIFGIMALRKAMAPGGLGKGAASELLNTAADLVANGELLAAKDVYARFINDFPNEPKVTEVQKRLEDLNIKLIYSAVETPDSFIYEVKPKDSLMKIAKENNTTVALIKKSNNLNDDKIRPGSKLKISEAKFNIFVDKSQNILILKNGEEIVKNYNVSTGKNNCTPTGEFKIDNKIVDPPWFKDGKVIPPESPENILGSRWMGFNLAGYGIHGTTEPETIGQQVTQGCVRMRNQDVEELFDIIPVGTEVIIVD